LHENSQLVIVDGEHFAAFADASADEAAQATQHVHLAGEPARLVHDHQLFAADARPHYLDAAGKHHHELSGPIPDLDEDVALPYRNPFAVRLQSRDLLRGEPRKHLVAAALIQIHRGGPRVARYCTHESSMATLST
jgi:hypothetical protein